MYVLYLHKNKINDKVYIGITKQTLSRRWRQGKGYKSCPRFYHAIQKYGWDNFEHIILLENLKEEEALQKEKEYIAKYESNNPEKGYNISEGGDIPYNSQQISEINKIRWKEGVYDKIKTVVYCVETETYYESALEAERQTGIDNSTIQRACKNKLKYAGISNKGQPLHWLYKEDVNEERIKNLKNKKEIIKGQKIPVFCPELNEHFSGTKEIYEKYGFDPSSIRKAIRNNRTAYKHHITKEPLHWFEDWN